MCLQSWPNIFHSFLKSKLEWGHVFLTLVVQWCLKRSPTFIKSVSHLKGSLLFLGVLRKIFKSILMKAQLQNHSLSFHGHYLLLSQTWAYNIFITFGLSFFYFIIHFLSFWSSPLARIYCSLPLKVHEVLIILGLDMQQRGGMIGDPPKCRSFTTRWAIIPTEGLSGPLWIGGKPLTYSKPIIGNGTHCELVGWTSKDLGPNGAFHLPTHHQPRLRDKRTMWCACKQILNKTLLRLRHRTYRT